MYKVSIVVPIFGVEKYIERCARSLFEQTYDKIEFIFVNDGTKDRSMEILESLIDEKFSHLKERIVIINKENGGLPSARKAGLECAEGEYVLFADSDDWLDTNAVAKVMTVAERTGAALALYADEQKRARLVRKIMETDFSWSVSAKRYLQLYSSL